jgi:hypothetical protein
MRFNLEVMAVSEEQELISKLVGSEILSISDPYRPIESCESNTLVMELKHPETGPFTLEIEASGEFDNPGGGSALVHDQWR